jgi:glycosyltransferase involved in cell wall biosynthesis
MKAYDGLFLAISCLPLLWRLRRRFDFRVIDSHFAYPDGYAAMLLGRWLSRAVTITLRGTEASLSRFPSRRRRIIAAVNRAERVFSVAESISRHLHGLGVTREILRIGNGVDVARFFPEPRSEARRRLSLGERTRVLVSVGGLCERKGFHRVIEVLPALRARFPEICLLIIGGAGPEGDWSMRLRAQVRELGLEAQVRFLGRVDPDSLRWPLSASDVFVLATSNEGWANVFLEAMACGLPVVTTDVGGNHEVIAEPELGSVVPFGSSKALEEALEAALGREWDRKAIRDHAVKNSWDQRVHTLVRELRDVAGGCSSVKVDSD